MTLPAPPVAPCGTSSRLVGADGKRLHESERVYCWHWTGGAEGRVQFCSHVTPETPFWCEVHARASDCAVCPLCAAVPLLPAARPAERQLSFPRRDAA